MSPHFLYVFFTTYLASPLKSNSIQPLIKCKTKYRIKILYLLSLFPFIRKFVHNNIRKYKMSFGEKNNSLIILWKNKFSEKGFRNEFLIVISILIISLISLSNFLLFNELREGTTLYDPVLNLFSPVDVTWFTFLIIYAGLIIAIIHLIKFPELLTLTLLAYSITALMRLFAMYTLPLNPPVNMIPLNDPFVQLFGTGNILLKDLFFSGHTSTLFILYLIIKNKKLKMLFLVLTISVAVCVLIQHVHYTVDVLAAPFFTYGSFILAQKFLNFIKRFS